MIGIAAFGNFETENVMKSQSNSRRSLFGIILRLAWPTIVEQALQTIVIYINTAMIGELGKNASAAVGLTATVCWLINSPAFAIGIGATACISRAIGEENAAEVRTYAAQAVKASLVLGLIMTALTLGISPFLPAWLGAEPVIQHDASVYFALICAPYLLNAMNIIFGAVLRGDVNKITVGDRVNIQDGVVVHTLYQRSVTEIGDDVSIGHNANIHGARIESRCLIGMGATVLDHAVVGTGSIVAANSLVLSRTVIEPGSVYAGVPAKRVKDVTPEQVRDIIERTARDYMMYASWYKE